MKSTNNHADKVLKEELATLINKGNAHATLEQVTNDIKFENLGIRPNNLPYSIWKLIEHIRITQWDILEFSKSADHKSPKWPEEYWPKNDGPKDQEEWKSSLAKIKEDREKFIELINDPDADLYAPFDHGDGQNLLREALLIADHTSHHLGEVIVLRRLLNDWKAIT